MLTALQHVTYEADNEVMKKGAYTALRVLCPVWPLTVVLYTSIPVECAHLDEKTRHGHLDLELDDIRDRMKLATLSSENSALK